MSETFRLGVVGVGVVGGAVYKYFQSCGKNVEVVGYDKYRTGFDTQECFNKLLECDALFLCLPTLYKHELKQYDKSAIHDVSKLLNESKYQGLVVVKSTVEPGTTEELSSLYESLDFCHNPEFLTARTAYDDFANQTHIVLGKPSRCNEQRFERFSNFLQRCWPKAEYSSGSSTETESMKIFCNSFYAQKVSIFNEFYQVCQHNKTNYEHVLGMMLKNGWINPMHTKVPGPDGRLGYGGMCLIKDSSALHQYMLREKISCKMIEASVVENAEIRTD